MNCVVFSVVFMSWCISCI